MYQDTKLEQTITQEMKELLQDVRMEDLSEDSKGIVGIIGIEKFLELCYWARGQRFYFPRPENVVLQARNRKIRAEFDGQNYTELSRKYRVTPQRIRDVLNYVS